MDLSPKCKPVMEYSISKLLGAPSCLKNKDSLSRYRDFHYKDNMAIRRSYVYNGNPYTDKMAYLYGNSPLALKP